MSEIIDRDSLMNQPVFESLTWKVQQPGDMIIGKCLMCDFNFSTGFGTKLHIKIDADEVVSGGETLVAGVYSIWEKAHLRLSVIQAKLTAGDKVGIFFLEEVPCKRGNSKKIFKVQVIKTPESGVFVAPAMDVNDAMAGDQASSDFDGKTADEYVQGAGGY